MGGYLTPKRLQSYLNKAIRLAESCDFSHRCQHISFLIRKNKVLAVGFNSKKTDAWVYKNGYCWGAIHSEASALKPRKINYDHSGTILINIRILRTKFCKGSPTAIIACAAPCNLCLALARSCGVEAIYFTDKNGNFSVIK